MKHIFLIIIFLLTTHSSQPMNSQKNNKPSRATQLCLEGIEKNSPAQVKEALLAGADVNYTNNNGESFFYMACEKNESTYKTDIVTALVTHENINVTARNRWNSTPLHVACEIGLSATVKSMLEKNPEMTNLRDDSEYIPLHIASAFGHQNCIELLLTRNNTNINCQSYDGNTALHLACRQKSFNCITLLIEQGANTTIKNNLKATPFAAFFYSFDEYLLHSTWHDANINSKNNYDLICKEYTTLCNCYMTDNTSDMKEILDNREALMHAFLRLTSPYIQCALFKYILEQKDANDIQLPPEVMSYLMHFYYALNIETITAKKYKDNCCYYYSSIENKRKIKRNLLTTPQPKLLWSAS